MRYSPNASLLGLRGAFGFPIPGLSFAIPLGFRFPFDRIGGDLAVVFHGPFVAVELPRDGETDFITFDFAVLDFGFDLFATLAGSSDRAGDFVALNFQFE